MRLNVPLPLRWADLDEYGHVNNVEFMRLLEEARVRTLWADVAGAEPEHPTAVLPGGPGAKTWSLVARVETEYLTPMPYTRAPIDIEVWFGKIGGASFEMCFELYSPVGVQPRVLYGRAMVVLVTVGAQSGSPMRILDSYREAWAPFVEEAIRFTRR